MTITAARLGQTYKMTNGALDKNAGATGDKSNGWSSELVSRMQHPNEVAGKPVQDGSSAVDYRETWRVGRSFIGARPGSLERSRMSVEDVALRIQARDCPAPRSTVECVARVGEVVVKKGAIGSFFSCFANDNYFQGVNTPSQAVGRQPEACYTILLSTQKQCCKLGGPVWGCWAQPWRSWGGCALACCSSCMTAREREGGNKEPEKWAPPNSPKIEAQQDTKQQNSWRTPL
ncbi:hypothetical protein B0T21DRAFT_350247 [Apiosordaria backusii]|uniref:Uncharacterized protein n=1 Tax=Apiosordaria backusii TaxID=314023 RepID=A0AA40B7Z8_9PEZI|nr:hypothetical protein B0T21DRAFT_350247 [Apiosordaria backusii]